jgi:flagellar hook-associated protein 2
MSPLSLSGLASGLDTETIITQLMSVEQKPRTRLALQDTQAQSRQTQLKDIASKLATVRDAAAALRSTTTWTDTQSLTSSDATRVGVRALGSAAPGSRLIEVSKLAVSAQHAFTYTANAAAQSIAIGAFTLAVDPNSDAATVAQAINARNDAPVSAVVAGGKLVLTSRTSGAAGDFAVAAGPLLSEDATYARAGANAAYTLDGSPRTSASNVITDAVLGVELTLKATTTAPVSVAVGAPGVDRDGVKTKVQAFVTAYNTTVDLIRAKLAEKPVKGATTTTDAVKGQFFGDSMLTSMLSSMRSAIGDLSDLGISTGTPSGTSKYSSDAVAGHLTIDDVKLTAALATDPAALKTRVQDFSQRMTAAVAPVAGSPIDVRLTTEETTRKQLADGMAATDVRLADKEKRLRAQFTAMESALAAAHAAQARLTSQLSALK